MKQHPCTDFILKYSLALFLFSIYVFFFHSCIIPRCCKNFFKNLNAPAVPKIVPVFNLCINDTVCVRYTGLKLTSMVWLVFFFFEVKHNGSGTESHQEPYVEEEAVAQSHVWQERREGCGAVGWVRVKRHKRPVEEMEDSSGGHHCAPAGLINSPECFAPCHRCTPPSLLLRD